MELQRVGLDLATERAWACMHTHTQTFDLMRKVSSMRNPKGNL